jgi:MFS family permease
VVLEEARAVADELGLPPWWLNEQASTYVAHGGDPAAPRVFDHPGLRVSAASPEHLLAMQGARRVILPRRGYRPVPMLRLKHLPRRPLGVLLGATLLSVAGDGITQVGVPWLVLLTTGSAGKAGIVVLCAMLPATVSSLVGGTLVDRAGARSVSVISDVACCAAVATIPVLQITGVLRFWGLCTLMAATGLLNAPGNTARAVILLALTRHSRMPLSRAAGIHAGAARAASIIGSAAGGLLIAALGPAHALFVDAGTFAASAILVVAGIRRSDLGGPGQAIRPEPARPGRGYRRDVRDGIRHVMATPLLLGITLLTLVAQGLDQGWSAVILPVDVRDKLHSVLVLGTAESAFAAGALIGALLYTTRRNACHAGPCSCSASSSSACRDSPSQP